MRWTEESSVRNYYQFLIIDNIMLDPPEGQPDSTLESPGILKTLNLHMKKDLKNTFPEQFQSEVDLIYFTHSF